MFRRDISEKHEKSSTAQLLSFVLLVALIAVVVRLGAPGLEPQQPHDPASVAAMPYTLVGEGDTWRLTVRVEPADEMCIRDRRSIVFFTTKYSTPASRSSLRSLVSVSYTHLVMAPSASPAAAPTKLPKILS